MRYENRAFENETLVLDGNEYIDCTFRNCTLTYSGTGPAGLIKPMRAQGITVEFQGAALVAVNLYQQVVEAGLSQGSPIGSFLRVADAWFQRIDTPTHLGNAVAKTNGMEVVFDPNAKR